MIPNASDLLDRLRHIHMAIRDAVVATCEHNTLEQLAAIVAEQAGDTIFAIDRISEEVLLTHFADLISSDVPMGKGVSSSAALEVVAMQAICAVSQIHLERREIALLCQRVENYIVGAPLWAKERMLSVTPPRILSTNILV